MGLFKIKASDYKIIETEEKKIRILKKDVFDSFNEDILGLGKIDMQSKQISALCVIFDLEGFTEFCKQIDPQLAVPEYLSEFLQWIFKQVRSELTIEEFEEGSTLFTDMPFLVKYLGDGLLFLWDTENLTDLKIRNVVICMLNICDNYRKVFLPKISKEVAMPPSKLRCGIARGSVYSVGNGNDYVGPCINMASRLQKLFSLSFCFSRRGIDPQKYPESMSSHFLTKKVNIRGIGDGELVCLRKSDFSKLSDIEKKNFKDI